MERAWVMVDDAAAFAVVTAGFVAAATLQRDRPSNRGRLSAALSGAGWRFEEGCCAALPR